MWGRAAETGGIPYASASRSDMNIEAVATDYDGTLAHDGIVDETTVAALVRAREAGLKLLMVTGRELSDLFNTFEHSSLFDVIVAENGAVLYHPTTEAIELLRPPHSSSD